jgi:hypothetical protein
MTPSTPHVKGIPTKVDTAFAIPAFLRLVCQSNSTIRRATHASMTTMGMKSTHDAGHNKANIGTPASALAIAGLNRSAVANKYMILSFFVIFYPLTSDYLAACG